MFRQIHSIRQLRKSIFFQQSKTLKLALVSQVESPTFPPFYCLCQNSTLLSRIKKKKNWNIFTYSKIPQHFIISLMWSVQCIYCPMFSSFSMVLRMAVLTQPGQMAFILTPHFIRSAAICRLEVEGCKFQQFRKCAAQDKLMIKAV